MTSPMGKNRGDIIEGKRQGRKKQRSNPHTKETSKEVIPRKREKEIGPKCCVVWSSNTDMKREEMKALSDSARCYTRGGRGCLSDS